MRKNNASMGKSSTTTTAPNCGQSTLTSHQVVQRQKQVDMGKQSREYWLYAQCVPKHRRRREWENTWHPSTPEVRLNCSTRAFQGLIRCWRRRLHLWGNLESDTYNLLTLDPAQFPPDVAKKRHQGDSLLSVNQLKPSSRREETVNSVAHETPVPGTSSFPAPHGIRNGGDWSVPPCVDDSSLQGLPKSRELWTASVASAKISAQLAQRFVLYHQDTVAHDENLGLLGRRNGGRHCAEVPVAFLPSSFRSIQRWPRCHFVRESDLNRVISDPKASSVFRDLNHHLRPQTTRILGSSVTGVSSSAAPPELLPQGGSSETAGCINRNVDGTQLALKNMTLTDRLRFEIQQSRHPTRILVGQTGSYSTPAASPRKPSPFCTPIKEQVPLEGNPFVFRAEPSCPNTVDRSSERDIMHYSVFHSRRLRF